MSMRFGIELKDLLVQVEDEFKKSLQSTLLEDNVSYASSRVNKITEQITDMADMMDSIRPDHVEEAPKQEQESDEEASGEHKSEINPEAIRSGSKSNNTPLARLNSVNQTISPPILGL